MTLENIMNTYSRQSVTFEKGEGIWLYDIFGMKYMDFVSGVAVNCLGHSHPKFVNAMKTQMETLIHVSNLYLTEQQSDLAKQICTLSGLSKAFFCNSGTEAVETAFKLSRKYGTAIDEKKNRVIVLENAFHGRTMGALSLTWNKKYKEPYQPLVQNIDTVALNDVDMLTSKMDQDVCAIIMEPIQGEGGIHKASKDFLASARELADEYGALLIFDEVQCGIARTGHVFAFESYGITPDVLCLAKGLGAGMPIGAVVVNERANVLVPGDHGSTFGGNPLACTAGLVVLDIVQQKTFLNDVQTVSDYLIDGLMKLGEKYKCINEIRGSGLMLGVDMTYTSKQLVEKAFEHKLLLIGAGENTVRLLPPLVITISEIDQFLDVFETVLIDLAKVS